MEFKELKGYDGNLMMLNQVKGLSIADQPVFKKKVEETKIPFKTIKKNNPNLPEGQEKVVIAIADSIRENFEE